MENENKDKSVMLKISGFIVDKRNLFFLIYIAAIIFSLFSSSWVSVCNDLTAYLPQNTQTRKGLTIMEDEFVTYATARVMVINVTYDEADTIRTQLEALPQVSMVTFDDSEEHYSETCAMFDVTLKGEDGDEITAEGYSEIEQLLAGYDVYITKSDEDMSKTLADEMNIVLAVAAVIIVGVLLFTSQTYMEVPVLLITFIVAAILNKGTNYIFGEISFVSNSVTAILQLALSIDYAIILIHRYSEERETHDQRDAVVYALSKAIVEILASSLTTVSGLMALMFMQFKIGFDMGLCLLKSILFSLISVFTLMPCLLMLFGKYIDKTHHKNFVPKISKLGDLVYKLRIVIPPAFLCLIIGAYFISSCCPFIYNANSAKTERKNKTQIAEEMIDEHFGTDNVAALIVPKGDYSKEKALIHDIEGRSEVKSVTGLSNISVKDDYVVTDSLTPRQFSELTDVDMDIVKMLYTLYAADNEDYGKIINNLDNFGVPLIDMFSFVFDIKKDGYIDFDKDMSDKLDDLYEQLNDAKLQLSGNNYTRMIIRLNLPVEGKETFNFVEEMHTIAAKYYDEDYFVGNSTSSYDLAKSFERDNIIVSLLSVIFVIIVLFFTFKSAGLPVLLIAVIQGSVWINFSFPYLTGTGLFFMSYLIVSSIQMGANIDYAIVISNRYLELKHKYPIKEAMRQSLNFAFPTVITSGSMLAAAGFLIGKLSTEPSIVSIGNCICRGTLISMFLVMCVLPEILLLGDTIIEKTKFDLKKPENIKNSSGVYMVNGRVRGYVNGVVDADIHGLVKGDIRAQIDINSISEIKEGNSDDEE